MGFWKNDNFFVGITVGLILTILTTVLLMIVIPVIYKMGGWTNPTSKMLLLAIIPSIIMMRFYMRGLGYNKSGSGTLLIVFITIIIYFAFIAGKIDIMPSLI